MSNRVVTLVNRTDKPFHFMYAGVSYCVPATTDEGLGVLAVTDDCAYHARKKSIMLYDLLQGSAVYQVAIDGVHDTSYLGKGKSPTDELIDRDTDPEGVPVRFNVKGGDVKPERGDALLEGE